MPQITTVSFCAGLLEADIHKTCDLTPVRLTRMSGFVSLRRPAGVPPYPRFGNRARADQYTADAFRHANARAWPSPRPDSLAVS